MQNHPNGPRQVFSAALLAAGLSAGVLGCGEGQGAREDAGQGPERPNLLLISIDSLRADHLGCYGHDLPTSPVMDQLAAEGARFEQAISTTSWTLPSHAAIFTGLHDSAHGVTDPTHRLAEDHITLAESLAQAGYRTAGFFGGPFLHSVFGLDQGFEVWESCMAEIAGAASRDDVMSAMSAEQAVMHGDITGPRTLAAVEAWSRQADARPFFLFVHLWDVHYDYLAPPSYVELFDPGYEGPVDGLDVERASFARGKAGRRDLRHMLALYDAEIRYTDEIIGDLLAGLRERGMLENTLVVVTADHGDEFLEHGGMGHQMTLFDEVLHVPLIFHWPGHLPAGLVVEQQVSLVSLAPTLLGLLGVDGGPASSGVDFGPLFSGDALEPLPAYSELLVDAPIYSLRTPELKVIWEPGKHAVLQAYDLTRDPGEEQRLLPESDPRIAAALEIIEARMAESADTASNAGLDAELQRRLGSLGYLDGASEEP